MMFNLVKKVISGDSDAPEITFETITEKTANHENAFYALAETHSGRKPLPWFFPEIKTFVGLGRTLHNVPKEDLSQLRTHLPEWVSTWVKKWEGEW